MKWSIIIALCIAIFGFIPGLGLPGAIAMSVGGLVISPFYQLKIMSTADAVWPAAIMATWIYPVFIPLAYWISYRKLAEKKKSIRILNFILVLFVGTLIVTGSMECMYLAEKAR